LLTAIGFTPGGSSTVHIYTQTIQRTTKNKQHIEQHKNVIGTVRAVRRLGELSILRSNMLKIRYAGGVRGDVVG
jgi:hypothetical protein